MRSLLLLTCVTTVTAGEPLTLQSGDRVVFVGGTLIEREQQSGAWESALTRAFPDANVTFRNLAWSGDTVEGTSRVAFDLNKPGIGLKRLIEHVKAEKPTVIFVGYGMAEALEGQSIDAFKPALNTLLDQLAETKAKLILLTPLGFAKPAAYPASERVTIISTAMREVAQKRQLTVVDLAPFAATVPEAGWDGSLHLNAVGYASTAPRLLAALGAPEAKTGPYEAALAEAIQAKNRLYFYRWRPQNETYLFGFRRHEQGRNAAEVVQFDPLIAAAEKKIAELKAMR